MLVLDRRLFLKFLCESCGGYLKLESRGEMDSKLNKIGIDSGIYRDVIGSSPTDRVLSNFIDKVDCFLDSFEYADMDTVVGEIPGLDCFGYCGDINDDILNVIKTLNSEHLFVTELAKKLNLGQKYVELIQYAICHADLADYGGSPRGCWLTPWGKWVINKIQEAGG